MVEVIAHLRAGDLIQPKTDLSATGVLLIAGLLAWALPRARGLILVGGLQLYALLAAHGIYDQNGLWQKSFDRLYLTIPVLTLAALPAAILARRRAALLASAAILAALWLWSWRSAPPLRERTTDHLEYVWLRPFFAKLPPDCGTLHIELAGQRTLLLPTYLSRNGDPRRFHPLEAHDPPTRDELADAASRCTYYLHTSLCTSREGEEPCAALERRLVLEPIARATFPAVLSHMPYSAATVESTISRVIGVR
jgi:hypothetical protein